MSTIKTRFAPSPTGNLHIGGARTAFFAWLYAKSQNGACLLRIEDTDRERSKDEFTKEIIESFKWLGIEFDEEVIYQSKNVHRYKEIIDQLLDQGAAYVCKGEDTETDKEFRDKNLLRDENTVVRFKMPEKGVTVYEDIVKGPIEVENEQLEDFIIERSDGSATYNLCVVVDDVDSGISHIIRGDDHINNTFKQINVFRALKKEVPTYGHVPMILGEDGKRLSKRHGAVAVREYEILGILPEALKNYFLRLGWSNGDDEIFSEDEMKNSFQLGVLNKSPATFSMDKLLWFNKYYLDQMNTDQLIETLANKNFDGSEYSKTILETIRDRCSTLNEFSTNSEYFFKTLEKKYKNYNISEKGFPKIWDYKFVRTHNSVICSSVVLKRDILEKINNFSIRPPPGEDYDCWLKALKNTDSVYVNDICFYYDMRHGKGRNY